jgi:hypothetical protein
MAKARRALDNLEARNEIKMRGFGITEDIDDKTLVWYTSPL